MMRSNLPTKRTVLVNTKSVASFIAATAAQQQLDAILHTHNKELRHEREDTKAQQDASQFLWGQDFDIEPDVWEEFDTKYT
jgi:hypothetical protein